MRRRYRPPMTGAQRVRVFCFFLAVVLITLGVVGTVHLRGLLGNLAETAVSNMVGQVVTEAVSDTIANGDIRYERLISFEKDNNGDITALHSNMAEFNRLQAGITQEVLTRLGEVAERDLVIPLGTLTGSALLAGRGPSFTVRMQSVGSCSARFENRFSQAGINQTTHRIILCVEVNMSILLPGFQTSTQVDASFSVAETVIVGDVPESYTYFDSGNPIEEDALEYTMNNG
ncbi:MAG: sporulation protein YunB [Oscillospiraceae bacterium]|jgi:sporulation protein YunB|nr:sporulation protein YunB [Oscillospiraceae bacterium]